MKKKETKKTGATTFQLYGEIAQSYEGKKWDYCTVRVDIDDSAYDLVRVAFPKDADIEEGKSYSVSGNIRAYYNKDKKVTEYTFYATDYEEG